jgi:cytochrome P450
LGHIGSGELYDPTSAEAHENPYPAYARMRDEFPLYYCRSLDVWALSRYQDVRAALRDWETFTSELGVEVGEYVRFFGNGSIQELDPPRHDILRKILAPRFQVRRIREYEPMVRESAEEILGHLRGRVVLDLGQEYTRRLPILTVFRVIGIPERDIDWAMRASLEMLDRPSGESGPTERAREKRGEIVDYMVGQVRRRLRGEPTDDVLSDIAAGIKAGLMDVSEIQGLMLLLVAAGMETTTSLMGSIVHALADGLVAPDQLLGGDAGLRGSAVDEFVRWDAPAQWLSRVTTRPVVIHGEELPVGTRVLLIFGSANRDPREFAQPDDLILGRDGSRNLSFGEGIHLCLGMPLARLETRVGITSLLNTLPRFRSAGPPVRYRSHVIRGFEGIPVRFD